MSVKLKLNTRKFATQLKRLKSTSQRSFGVLLAENIRGFVREAVAVTPPGMPKSQTGDLGTAKGRGTRAVARDIRQIMRGVNIGSRTRIQSTDLASVHRSYRSRKDGRTVKIQKKNRVRVPAASLRAYIRSKQRNVGKLAAGWSASAKKAGARVPTWIARHKGEGKVKVQVNNDRFRFVATNSTDHASLQKGLQRRIQVALYTQGNNMKRRVNSSIKKNAIAAGLKAK